ncbi:MAG: DUF59 domain-containing protein [Chthoniobacterales bacterium]|nr:DUF59 domain-containing protein [Chthoniobacterales bacterium]
MSADTQRTTSRDIEVCRIPSGEKITLPAQTQVVITQALGGSYTILVPSQAGLFRVEARDADAIGHAPVVTPEAPANTPLEDLVWSQLRTCYDPEIPINIVDLGLVYSVAIQPAATGSHVTVQMTLTAPGCGMGPIIASEARQKILTVEGVSGADVDLVWEPAWAPERISPEGRQKLGMA